VYRALAERLKRQPEFAGDIDWASVATVLGGAIVNHWLACSQMHAPPLGVDEERFIDSWVRLALGLVAAPADPGATAGRTVTAAHG
jgi:hypothetical protein